MRAALLSPSARGFLNNRLPESTSSSGFFPAALRLSIIVALPGSPPSSLDFQPQGSYSPKTLLEWSRVKNIPDCSGLACAGRQRKEPKDSMATRRKRNRSWAMIYMMV
jgi:hypothetical protein